jgi:flavin reductase (DIM6/NTAB) family NADH-FMN oxidoreductase RutF
MIHVEPKDIPNTLSHSYLLGGVGPRPIALVSTLSTSGVRNLSPFSYFNGFGVNPVTVAFSPARRNRDGTFKHTYYNLTESKECVIQCVTYGVQAEAITPAW